MFHADVRRSTAVFSFEGIGLASYQLFHSELHRAHVNTKVIPISDSMREPHKFPRALTGVMIFLTGQFQSKIL
jgi:solute carrier family 36 (proton-coupled amino acid transporter)